MTDHRLNGCRVSAISVLLAAGLAASCGDNFAPATRIDSGPSDAASDAASVDGPQSADAPHATDAAEPIDAVPPIDAAPPIDATPVGLTFVPFNPAQPVDFGGLITNGSAISGPTMFYLTNDSLVQATGIHLSVATGTYFSIASDTCGPVLAGGTSCEVFVQFGPATDNIVTAQSKSDSVHASYDQGTDATLDVTGTLIPAS